MRSPVIAYITAFLTMAVLDGSWIAIMAGRLYRPQIGALMLDKPALVPAVLFYLLYVTGVTALVTLPAVHAGSLGMAAARGALLGVVAYGTYDLTNLATIRGWTTTVCVADMVWGLVLTAVASSVAYFVTSKFG